MICADVGASQLIIDGKIKLKNDSQISEFTERGLKFDDGSELPVDVVVFATGCVSHSSLHRSIDFLHKSHQSTSHPFPFSTTCIFIAVIRHILIIPILIILTHAGSATRATACARSAATR
jgi:hypothetical protein